jgi:GxxExxY protein
MTENEIASQVVDSAYRIHTTLGPGLLESVYDTVLAYELGPARSPHRYANKRFP